MKRFEVSLFIYCITYISPNSIYLQMAYIKNLPSITEKQKLELKIMSIKMNENQPAKH